MEDSNKDDNSNKHNVAAGKSISCWKSLSKCIIDITQFLEKAKSYEQLIKDGVLADAQELQRVWKRIVSVFTVNECSLDTVIKSLTPLGVKPQRLSNGNGRCMWTYCYPRLPNVRTTPVGISLEKTS